MLLKIWLGSLAALVVLLAWAHTGHASALGPRACDVHCKVRIHACHVSDPTKCFAEDLYPERTGLCAFMMMGVVAEWQTRHGGETFKAAECVALDDSEL